MRFTFSPNDYFTNSILDKTFIHGEKEEITKTEGSKIEWKEGKDLTKKIVKKVFIAYFKFFRSKRIRNQELNELYQRRWKQKVSSAFLDQLI